MIDSREVLERIRVEAGSRAVMVWGAGRAGTNAVRFLRDHGVEPSGFIDARGRRDWNVEGLPVHPPAALRSLGDVVSPPFIVVASLYAAEIVTTAASYGLCQPRDVVVLEAPPNAWPGVTNPLVPDFYQLLHELRGHALADMPRGAQTLLSAGCSGRWYFDWVAERYGPVARHIGVERFLPKPDDLPATVEWLARDISSVPEVANGEVDLVFSGQNIEHLWPDQVEAFLVEANRVLKTGGWLVLDSPNREVTASLAWSHPEHTTEYSVSETRALLDLAGFGDVRVRGIWLSREADRVLPLSPFVPGAAADSMAVLRRAALAGSRAEDAFVWWAEARKQRPPQREALHAALSRLFRGSWPERLNRFVVPGPVVEDGEGRWALVAEGQRGMVAEGPLFPLRLGRHILRFRVRGQDDAYPCRVRLEVTQGLGDQGHPLVDARCVAGVAPVSLDAMVTTHQEMTFAVRARLIAEGGGAGGVQLDCRLESCWDGTNEESAPGGA